MLIPSVDLMSGKIVQLVQGERKALEFENFAAWVDRFSAYPLIQLIDLDAAKSSGSNGRLITEFCSKLPCQVGGGIRSVEDARRVLASGARKVLVGSSLIREKGIDVDFAKRLHTEFGADRLVFAVDSRGGSVAIHGWRTLTGIPPSDMLLRLDPYCSAFLYTHIDTEGLMKGIPLNVIEELRRKTSRRLIAAGGISSHHEIDALESMGVDAVVGMAIYSGRLKLT
jgi:phosphoribosylformimino-5-aminoimidazole carboxamide ribotide isomerase